MTLFQGLYTALSCQTCTYLAYGWALAMDCRTITTSLGQAKTRSQVATQPWGEHGSFAHGGGTHAVVYRPS
jgi:hypothetical protein